MEMVILVNEQDEQVGLMEKMEAHEKAILHRAFSVFVFNSAGDLLIHQRAVSKYHSPSLWTNTCCSHPRDGETGLQAAHRRLEEEMGFDCEVEKAFDFIYKAEFDNGLTEHELDHVYIGEWEGTPTPNAEEVGDWKYMPLDEIVSDMEASPEKYTVWFRIAMPRVVAFLESRSAVKKG